jgi:hypothetical protein
MQDWGLQFPQAKLDASIAKTQLKKFATVEVSIPSLYFSYSCVRSLNTYLRQTVRTDFTKDVAEQVLCFVKSQTVTGSNAVIDAGWSL